MQYLIGVILGLLIAGPFFAIMVRLLVEVEAEADRWCDLSCRESERLVHYIATGELLHDDNLSVQAESDTPGVGSPDEHAPGVFFENK